MKFVVVEGRALKQAMKIVAAIIERRNTIPVLNCARITHSDAGLRITIKDEDATMTRVLMPMRA